MTTDDVYQMLDQGILDEEEPLELIHGSLIEMSPQSPAHAFLTEEVARIVEQTARDAAPDAVLHTRTHSPLHVDRYNEPEPDVALVRGRPRDYAARHPEGGDCLLLVEIAHVRSRARAKLGLYAHAGVPEVWIVDLDRRRLEAHREPVTVPAGPGASPRPHRRARYRTMSAVRSGGMIAVPSPEGASSPQIPVDRLLP